MAIRRPPTTFSDTISTADIADDAVTGGKLANDIAISTTGNIATTGSGTLTVAGASNFGSVASGTLASAVAFPAGHVLQVVSTEDDTMAGYTNQQHVSFQDLISLAITPSATSSKILLHVSIAGGVTAYGVSYRIMQNSSTVSDHLGASSSRRAITFGLVPYATNNDEVATVSYTGLFSPSSTSAVTYKIQGAGRAASWAYNRGEDATNTSDRANAVSTLTLMEIKG